MEDYVKWTISTNSRPTNADVYPPTSLNYLTTASHDEWTSST